MELSVDGGVGTHSSMGFGRWGLFGCSLDVKKRVKGEWGAGWGVDRVEGTGVRTGAWVGLARLAKGKRRGTRRKERIVSGVRERCLQRGRGRALKGEESGAGWLKHKGLKRHCKSAMLARMVFSRLSYNVLKMHGCCWCMFLLMAFCLLCCYASHHTPSIRPFPVLLLLLLLFGQAHSGMLLLPLLLFLLQAEHAKSQCISNANA